MMTSWWRAALGLLLCGVGAVVLGPGSAASAAPVPSSAPVPSAGVGRVVADLGSAWVDPSPGSELTQPGFSHDGAYYAYLVRADGRCDLRLYDVTARTTVDLAHDHVVCDQGLVRWAGATDTLVWQVDATAGAVTVYAWDQDPGQVSVLAADAQVYAVTGVSADGRLLSFLGRSDTQPAPSVDAPRYAGYVYDRRTGVSVPLSKPDVHVHLVGWSPQGENFVADTGGHTSVDLKSGSCIGSGTSCRYFPDQYEARNDVWSADGTVVVISPGTTGDATALYDFADASLTPIATRFDGLTSVQFIGADARRLLVRIAFGRAVVWDRTTDTKTLVYANNESDLAPDGRYLLYRGSVLDTWRYLDPAHPVDAAATFRGTDGYWTGTGSAFLGLGPQARPSPTPYTCPSSLRQWSPSTNTVTIYPAPGNNTCYDLVHPPDAGAVSSASGRFALVQKYTVKTGPASEFVVDLRRHVLLGPVEGFDEAFSPAGPDLLAVPQPRTSSSVRLLLVDPTPVPDVDDKPRWSAATPATGARVEAVGGAQVHVQLGASDLQSTPVNLYVRWRDTAGNPIASAPQGWSCERRRLAGGATEADCTFAPPARGWTATRFLDVSATSSATGAQSDTRSYRVSVGS